MSYFLKSLALCLFLSPVFALEKDNSIESPPPSHITISIPQNEEDKYKHEELSGQIDTLEDVENAGCAIGCLRAMRTCSTSTAGFFGFISGLGNTVKTTLTTLSVLGDYSPELKKYLGIASTVVNSTTLVANIIATSSSSFALANQKELQDIEDQIAAVLAKYNNIESKPQLKAPRLSKEDQKQLTTLQERYESITNLNCCEKGCFSCWNFLFGHTRSLSLTLEFICNIANLIMVPIATIPIWDPQVETALKITVVATESASVFFNKWSQQAQKRKEEMIKLRHNLDQYN